MKSTNQQLLRSPDIKPTNNVITKALGETTESYKAFVSELASHDIHIDWRYYTDGAAWLAKGLYKWKGPRGGQNELTVFWLSIWDGFFKVAIYIPEKARAEVLSLPLDHKVKLMITESKQMGKLKYFPLVFDVYSDEIFEAIFDLIDFKKRIR